MTAAAPITDVKLVVKMSNVDIDILVKHVGKRRIVYGEMLEADGEGERKLIMKILGPRNG